MDNRLDGKRQELMQRYEDISVSVNGLVDGGHRSIGGMLPVSEVQSTVGGWG
jgi:hypothetical protein